MFRTRGLSIDMFDVPIFLLFLKVRRFQVEGLVAFPPSEAEKRVASRVTQRSVLVTLGPVIPFFFSSVVGDSFILKPN
jgi:hypothetical protein